MTAYRFKRRAFLASLGGAFGLSTLLKNLEASAEGAGSPPRFLLLFWPCGTVPYLFKPTGSGRDYFTSSLLQPFDLAGLRDDCITLYGLTDPNERNGGGGHELGVVYRTTGARSPGTRASTAESDDSVAGGPSIDQILLKKAPYLARVGVGPVNAIGDARTDSGEVSARCLSYGYDTRSIAAAFPVSTNITEHVPLLPEQAPAQLFAQLFSSFIPGGNTPGNLSVAMRALQLRKSVLDYSLGELSRLETLVPASERPRIDAHAEAIRDAEKALSEQLATGLPPDCTLPDAPDSTLIAPGGAHNYYGSSVAEADESAKLALLGKLHLSVIRAAFQCDITRVATFQWTSSFDDVAFSGMYPSALDKAYRHHPLSHASSGQLDRRPQDPAQADIAEFLGNVHQWYNERTAEFLLSLKTTEDAFGNSLLDHTVVPFVTDVAAAGHTNRPLPALIFGGRALGMQGGQYQTFEASPRPFNDVWLSIVQAYFPDVSPLDALKGEPMLAMPSDFTGPIPGLWQRPV